MVFRHKSSIFTETGLCIRNSMVLNILLFGQVIGQIWAACLYLYISFLENFDETSRGDKEANIYRIGMKYPRYGN